MLNGELVNGTDLNFLGMEMTADRPSNADWVINELAKKLIIKKERES
jgi:hypothetical protein